MSTEEEEMDFGNFYLMFACRERGQQVRNLSGSDEYFYYYYYIIIKFIYKIVNGEVIIIFFIMTILYVFLIKRICLFFEVSKRRKNK